FRLMSENDLFLLFFYISLYAGIYIFSYLYLWFCVGTFRAFKERQ
ncbi:colicin immunity protein, partial [Salmonella enterica subsp. enterica serovar Bareilly]|nr:colicin immunity protein [Salmonella enterica subsp. enterica serovar Bareilly]